MTQTRENYDIEGMARLAALRPEVQVSGSWDGWRLGNSLKGEVLGVWPSVVLLATDGVGAFFELPDGRVVYGHIGHFVEEKEERVRSTSGERRPKRVSVTQQHLMNLAAAD